MITFIKHSTSNYLHTSFHYSIIIIILSPEQPKLPSIQPPSSLLSPPYLEALQALLDMHVLPGGTREHLRHVEGLAQEPLDLSGASHHQLVVFAQLIHTQNGDDVLEIPKTPLIQ